MKFKKYISLLLAAIFLFISISAFAGFTDVPADAEYKDALDRMTALGIMSGYGDGTYKPNDFITREQFAKIIVTAAGLDDTANTLAGASIFPDVAPDRWSSGYINAALNKGYITGMADGNFHPQESVTFAQACTVLVKALGYTDNDVTGLWPRNYIEKAKTLGLARGISLSSNDWLTRWAAAMMVDRLLETEIKSTNSGSVQTFADASGLYTECTILGSSATSDKLTQNQILTDKGTYYIKNAGLKLDLGSRYKLAIKDDAIINAYNVATEALNITVKSAVDTSITYSDGAADGSMTLPDKTIYYYEGAVQKYDQLHDLLQANTSVVLVYNADKTGFEYAVIFDPVYSKPELVADPGYDASAKKLGGTDGSNPVVVRNTMDTNADPQVNKIGEHIDISKIKAGDVVYQVSDIWGRSMYLLVVDNKINGTITGVLPNTISPKTVQIDGKNYEISKSYNYSQDKPDSNLKTDNDVTLTLGYDGKVVDIKYAGDDDNSNYALVVGNYSESSTDIEDYGKVTYYVKLLHTNNLIKKYKIQESATNYKGLLVKYNIIEDGDDVDTVSLQKLDYIYAGDYTVKKEERKLNDSYISDNAKIFNIKSNYSNTDVDASVIDWSSLPSGPVTPGKVKYVNRVGDFGDISVIVIDNILEEDSRLAVVKNLEYKWDSMTGSSYTYTMLISGKEYTYKTYIPGAAEGSVVKVKLKNGAIYGFYEVKAPWTSSSEVQAIDTKRIKINNTIYDFKSNICIYQKDSEGVYSLIGTNDISAKKPYSQVRLYTDRSVNYGGRVEIIILE